MYKQPQKACNSFSANLDHKCLNETSRGLAVLFLPMNVEHDAKMIQVIEKEGLSMP